VTFGAQPFRRSIKGSSKQRNQVLSGHILLCHPTGLEHCSLLHHPTRTSALPRNRM
jgi:hypothetical protein